MVCPSYSTHDDNRGLQHTRTLKANWNLWTRRYRRKNTEAFCTCSQRYPNVCLQSLYTEMPRSDCLSSRPQSFLCLNLECAQIHGTTGQFLSCRFSQSHLRNTQTCSCTYIFNKTTYFTITSQGSDKKHSCLTVFTRPVDQWLSNI